MKCHKCGGKTTVKYTVAECGHVYRHRICQSCNEVFYTTEEILVDSKYKYARALVAHKKFIKAEVN